MAPHVNHNQSTHMILDIHTHHPAPQPDGVINVSPGDALLEGQLYSAGIHPWTTLAAPSPELLGELERICSLPAVVAVGECGVDIARGGPLFRQLQVLKAHIELSERLGKPLILHEVKAHDIILGLRRDMQPSQPWVVHGFRGKPQVAEMLLHGGLWLCLLYTSDAADDLLPVHRRGRGLSIAERRPRPQPRPRRLRRPIPLPPLLGMNNPGDPSPLTLHLSLFACAGRIFFYVGKIS